MSVKESLETRPAAFIPSLDRATPAGRSSCLQFVLWGILLGAGSALLCEAYRVYIGSNLHEVIPGKVYRRAQPTGRDVELLAKKLGIRTIVNLRGCCDPFEWYLEESRATHQLGINQADIPLSAGRLPPTHEIRQVVEVLERSDYPILLHCKRGADRTGLVAVIAKLLLTDESLAEGLRQLRPRYAHVAIGRPAYLDQFFELYAEWLGQQRVAHSRDVFRRWLLEEYCPAECRARIEALEVPAVIADRKPTAIRIRAHNESVRTWHLRPGSNAGIHARSVLRGPDGSYYTSDRTGLLHKDIAPGESIDLTLVLPTLALPGRYRLMLDMTDEQHCWFYQAGSEPLEMDIEVR